MYKSIPDETLREYHPLANLFPLLQGEDYDALPLPFDLSDMENWLGAWGNQGKTAIVVIEPSYQRPYFYVTWGGNQPGYQRIERPVHLAAMGAMMGQLGIDPDAYSWKVQPSTPFDKGRLNPKQAPLVYFIEGGGLIKIGVSVAPEERIKQLQTISPVPLRILAIMPGGYEQERVLHGLFHNCRSHGEWFNTTPELLDYIGGLPK